MKTETEIAKENVKELKEQTGRTDWLGGETMDLEIRGEIKSHLASCQRFLGFLEEKLKSLNWVRKEKCLDVDTSDLVFYMIKDVENKITDLQDAIKTYSDGEGK